MYCNPLFPVLHAPDWFIWTHISPRLTRVFYSWAIYFKNGGVCEAVAWPGLIHIDGRSRAGSPLSAVVADKGWRSFSHQEYIIRVQRGVSPENSWQVNLEPPLILMSSTNPGTRLMERCVWRRWRGATVTLIFWTTAWWWATPLSTMVCVWRDSSNKSTHNCLILFFFFAGYNLMF